MFLGGAIPVKGEREITPIKGGKRSLLTNRNGSKHAGTMSRGGGDKSGEKMTGKHAPTYQINKSAGEEPGPAGQ